MVADDRVKKEPGNHNVIRTRNHMVEAVVPKRAVVAMVAKKVAATMVARKVAAVMGLDVDDERVLVRIK